MTQAARINVDFSRANGTIRRINGCNLGPRLYRPDNQVAEFQALEIPMVRLHDVPLSNYGMRLADIHHIFGNFRADADNPDNYYFPQTDDYIRTIRNAGGRVMYRLGTSIEHSREKYYAFPPEDFEQWTKIACNIIRHYNEGWNHGFAWNIQHWEIWNEPDGGASMWSASPEMYFKLYEYAAKKIKARFPNVKVGGPAICCLHGHGAKPFGDEFLAYCRDHDCPLDFYSWHSYERDPLKLAEEPAEARRLLDGFGFKNAELHLDEYHYWICEDWSLLPDERHRMDSARAAVHAMTALTLWQDTPLDMGEFYSIGYLDWFCPWGAWGNDGKPNKIYHAFHAFAQCAACSQRVEATSDTRGVQALAGRAENGDHAILITDFTTASDMLEVTVTGAEAADFEELLLDEEHNLAAVPIHISGNTLFLPTPAGESSLYLLRDSSRRA